MIVVRFLFIFGAVLVSSTVQAVSPMATVKPTGNCIHLLASTTHVASADSQFEAPSSAAKAILSLIELGYVNLGSESPQFLAALEQLVAAEGPMNPFVNLSSPLGRALARRSEPLLGALDVEWDWIRKKIVEQKQVFAADKIRRAQDQDITRSVEELSKISFSSDSAPPRVEDLYFIGETRSAIIFGLRHSRGLESEEAAGSIYRLSKSTHEFTLIHKATLPYTWYETDQWMHKGFVFGFGETGNPKPGQPPQEIGIFRLDPETGEQVWAEPWIQTRSETQPVRIAYRVHVSNSLIGAEVKDKYHAIGQVYRFDYDQLRFLATGLMFDETSLPGYRKPIENSQNDLRAVRGSNAHALRLGRFLKTNGNTIAAIGDSEEWRHWSADSAIRSTDRTLDRPKSELRLYQRQDNIEAYPYYENVGRGGPIKIRFRGQIYSSSSESVAKGGAIVFLGHTELKYPIVLQLIDQATWTAKPVEVLGGPSVLGNGTWQLVRNQSDDLLLRYDHGRVVALWKFDSMTGRFDLKLHEVLKEADVHLNSMALLDYEKLKLIAWVYTDHERNPVLRAMLPVYLSRDQEQPSHLKGSLP